MASKKEPLFPNDYWERTEPSTTGDLDQKEIFAAVGRALTTWETIEGSLATLCLIFSGLAEDAQNNKGFIRLLGSINSSSARRTAIRLVGEVYFGRHDDSKAMKKKLNELLENISKASRLRDDLAHGVVANFHSRKSDPPRALLVPSEYKADRNKAFVDPTAPLTAEEMDFPFHKLPWEYRYNSRDIEKIINKFHSLHQTVLRFARECINWKEQATSAP
jgi:hypothetical protein